MMNNYKAALITMIAEMEDHEIIYTFTFLSRMLGHEKDPGELTAKEANICDMLERVQKLNDEELTVVLTLIDKLIKEKENAA